MSKAPLNEKAMHLGNYFDYSNQEHKQLIDDMEREDDAHNQLHQAFNSIGFFQSHLESYRHHNFPQHVPMHLYYRQSPNIGGESTP